MPRKRTGYDAACYYDGKLLGRCTKADSDAYTLLMNACGGDAARVLREYAYFSPELRAILENAALMQADRNRTGGMFHAPKSSPWGEVQNCETLCPGVFLVSTASHGGTMVANEVAAVLSPAAKKCGFKDNDDLTPCKSTAAYRRIAAVSIFAFFYSTHDLHQLKKA